MSPLSPRDASALGALLSMRDEDGLSRPRARGHAQDASGLTWAQWRRSMLVLVASQLVLEVAPGKCGLTPSLAVYRVTEQGVMAHAAHLDRHGVGTGSARGAGTGSAQLPDPLPPLSYQAVREERTEDPDPEAVPAGTGVRHGGPARGATDEVRPMDLASAICYLADVLGRALGDRPAPRLASSRGPRKSPDEPDANGWTGHDASIVCTEQASHGRMPAHHNGADDSWFSRCAVSGCSGKHDPAVSRRVSAREADAEQATRATRPSGSSGLPALTEAQRQAMDRLRAGPCYEAPVRPA